MNSLADLLPWLNVLIVPAVLMLVRLSFQLGQLVTTVKHQGEDIKRIDSDVGELRDLVFNKIH